MKELVTAAQAQTIMLVLLVAAPIVGLVWGAIIKRFVPGLLIGLVAGAGNFLLWTVYNLITDRLGLDTVANLLVNLFLFILVGSVVGWVIARRRPGAGRPAEDAGSGGGGGAPVPATVGGPVSRTPGAARTIEESTAPPRDP